MKRTLLLVVFAATLAGCGVGQGDVGSEPPPPQPLTEASLSKMPPQASAGAQEAQARGAAMAQQYNARYK